METIVKETLPAQKESPLTVASQKRPSVWMQVRALGVRGLSGLLPQFSVPGYCLFCWARLELVLDLPTPRHGLDVVNGVRFWRCPDSGHGASTGYTCTWVHEPELWL